MTNLRLDGSGLPFPPQGRFIYDKSNAGEVGLMQKRKKFLRISLILFILLQLAVR
jgi:hypothetical protein